MTTSDFVLSRSHFRYTADIPGFTTSPMEVDTSTGGEGAVQMTSVRQGTSPNRTQVLGGPATYSDMTFTAAFSKSRNAWKLYRFLEGKQGKLTITLHRQPLDELEEPDPSEDSQVASWTLSTVQLPDYDADSSDAAYLTFGVSGGSWS